MALILTSDEMLAVIRDTSPVVGAQLQKRYETLASEMAEIIADDLKCSTSRANWDLDGMMAAFRPAYPGQEKPQVLAEHDPEGEWH